MDLKHLLAAGMVGTVIYPHDERHTHQEFRKDRLGSLTRAEAGVTSTSMTVSTTSLLFSPDGWTPLK